VIVRWWKRDGTMVKTRYNIAFYHRTIVSSRFHHRIIVFSLSYHRVFIIVSSYHRIITIVLSCIAGKDELKKSRFQNFVFF
jgi:hypothetical protein